MSALKNKIAVVGYDYSGGGLEKAMQDIATIIKNLGYHVDVFVLTNVYKSKIPNTVINLSHLPKVKKYLTLYKYFIKNNYAIVVDFRFRDNPKMEFFYYYILYSGVKVISTIHSSKIDRYLTKNNFASNFILKKSKHIVTVSKGIKAELQEAYNYNMAVNIYNPINFKKIEALASKPVTLNYEYIIWYGRLEEHVKNLTLLLDAYHQSVLKSQNIKLLILGNGEDENLIKSYVNTLGLKEFVIFKRYQENPYKYVKQAKFKVLSSQFEGFPMTIIESLACGTPVISVDCDYGPNEIITHKKNGLLVQNHNPKLLAQAFNTFVEDTALYNTCKANAKTSVQHLNMKTIGKQWQNLLQ